MRNQAHEDRGFYLDKTVHRGRDHCRRVVHHIQEMDRLRVSFPRPHPAKDKCIVVVVVVVGGGGGVGDVVFVVAIDLD